MGLFDKIIGKKTFTIFAENSFSANLEKAMQEDATVFSCMNLICSSISNIPLELLFCKSDGTTVKAGGNPLYSIVKYEPNADETPTLFMYNVVLQYLKGNAFIYIARNTDGEILGLYILDNSSMRVEILNGQKIFKYHTSNGVQTYTAREVLHIPSRWGYDPVTRMGKSIFAFGRQSLTLALQLNDFALNSYKNGLGKRTLIKTDFDKKKISEADKNAFYSKIKENYIASGNTGKPIVYDGDWKFDALNTNDTLEAAQLVQQRQFQEGEIAKFFSVPLILLGVGQNKYNSIESLYQTFIDFTLAPIGSEIENAFMKLIPVAERKNYVFKFNYNSIMRYDLTARIDAYYKQTGNVGWLTVNEIRKMENRPLLEGIAGETLFVPSNVMPATDEVLNAYMASSKLKMMGVEADKKIGDDKK